VGRPSRHMEACRNWIHIFWTLKPDGSGWPASRSSLFTPEERTPDTRYIGSREDPATSMDILEKRYLCCSCRKQKDNSPYDQLAVCTDYAIPARSLYQLRYTSSQPVPTTLYQLAACTNYTIQARILYRLRYTSSQPTPTTLYQLAAYTDYAIPDRSLYWLGYINSQPIPITLYQLAAYTDYAIQLAAYTDYAIPARSLYRLRYSSSQPIPTTIYQLAAYTDYAIPASQARTA